MLQQVQAPIVNAVSMGSSCTCPDCSWQGMLDSCPICVSCGALTLTSDRFHRPVSEQELLSCCCWDGSTYLFPLADISQRLHRSLTAGPVNGSSLTSNAGRPGSHHTRDTAISAYRFNVNHRVAAFHSGRFSPSPGMWSFGVCHHMK